MTIWMKMIVPHGPPGDILHDVLDEVGGAHPMVSCCKAVRPEQDPHDHTGQFEGAHARFEQQSPGQLTVDQGRNQCPEEAHGRSFCRGGHAEHDGAEHGKDDADRQDDGFEGF